MSLAPGSSSQPPAMARPPERFRLHVHAEDGNESRAMIVVSFVANVLVATAKTVAAPITRSSSMRTEAVHSWVDVGNECFVVAAARSARLPADEQHAFGFGRASYVWSLFASIGTLLLGAVVGVWQGVHELGEPDHGSDYFVGYVVIAVSFVLEGEGHRRVSLDHKCRRRLGSICKPSTCAAVLGNATSASSAEGYRPARDVRAPPAS